MARWPRVVIPDCPHHIILRGNHHEKVFFSDADRQLYLRLIKHHGSKHGISYLAYCLMTNHVHLVAVPEYETSFSRGFREALRQYSCLVNIRENLTGHLWQNRFRSYPLDEPHLFSAIRYIEKNPVRASIVSKPEVYRWSSARVHMLGLPDPLVVPLKSLPEPTEWSAFVHQDEDREEIKRIEEHALNGRPLGAEEFIARLETQTGRVLRYKKRGRKRGNNNLAPIS